MAKYQRIPKLPKKEQEQLLIELCEALTLLKNSSESAKLITDLLSRSEVEMIAKRLKIAKLLFEGKTYGEIRNILKVSSGTIGRVNLWLKISGEGYRMIIERTKTSKLKPILSYEFESWFKAHKRRYSQYYRPSLLWEEIMKNLTRRKKEKILENLSKVSEKEKIYEEFSKILSELYGSKKKLTGN
jgi:TrpR-related protein YerC/YecD